ncbi:prismalin-14-like [Penaeus chinensis]|uniref:prismalin-14-like n=1 Tax=Penaeus chinensis TaxID=139456 RepID=UPI001FB7B7C4|nr:prismalin-14-like [Penaeus chinensis]
MKQISMVAVLVVALACLVSWSSAMPEPDPVADPDPGYRRFGGLGYGGYGLGGLGYGYGGRGYGYGGFGYGGYRGGFYG